MTNTTNDIRCVKCGQDLIHTGLNSNSFTNAYVCLGCGHTERLATDIRKKLLWSVGGLYAVGVVLGALGKKS